MNTVLKRLAWVTHLYEVGSPIRDQVEALAARHEVIRIHLVEAHEAEQNLLATIGKLWTEAEITQAKADAAGLACRVETVGDETIIEHSCPGPVDVSVGTYDLQKATEQLKALVEIFGPVSFNGDKERNA